MNAKTILVFMFMIGVLGLIAIYLGQRQTEKTIIIERIEPAPATPQAPVAAPVPQQASFRIEPQPKAPVPAVPAPPKGLQLQATSIVFKQPPPACIKIQEKIRVAQQVIDQLTVAVAAAKRTALQRVIQSPDYLALKAQLGEKKQAKDEVVSTLQKDKLAGIDTDQDASNVQTATADWITLSGQLTKMREDAVANDPTATEKQQDILATKTDMADLQKQLNNYITHEIVPLCNDAICWVDNIHLDPDTWTIHVDLTPLRQRNPQQAADDAFNCVGIVLETLHKSPFTWQTIQFKVFDTSKNVEFQLTYDHSDIAKTNFELAHETGLLYPPLAQQSLKVGTEGDLLDVTIGQIIDNQNMLVYLWDDIDETMPVWVRGVDTTNHVDHSNVDIDVPLAVVGTIRYETSNGSNTVFLLEPTGFKQNLVIGTYFDNGRLIDMAQKIWLNNSIDQLQGRAPIPDSYLPQPGMEPPKLINTLKIGGYKRDDGSRCQLVELTSPHPVHAAAPDIPIVRAPPMPTGITANNPMIVSRPPPP